MLPFDADIVGFIALPFILPPDFSMGFLMELDCTLWLIKGDMCRSAIPDDAVSLVDFVADNNRPEELPLFAASIFDFSVSVLMRRLSFSVVNVVNHNTIKY